MKLDLKRVTAICIDGRPADRARNDHYRKIVSWMMSQIEFFEVKLLMTEDPHIAGAKFVEIEPIRSLDEYSNFCLRELHSHVDSDYCLVFQDDGFVVNPELWNPEFFEYDYIGAPWPPFEPWPEAGRFDRRVGNGGFSLRSKRLLEFTKDFVADRNEDIVIASTRRDEIDAAGLKVAPLEVALDFSIETEFVSTQSMHSCFGFHHRQRVDHALQIISEKSEQSHQTLV